MVNKLTHDNFVLYCASHYDNYQYHSTDEFYEDLLRIKYIRKLITIYLKKGDLKERLILNHIIVLNNCFGPEVTSRILYLKLQDQFQYVKPFLVLLNILPEFLYEIENEEIIDTNLISMDAYVVEKLRNDVNGYKKNI